MIPGNWHIGSCRFQVLPDDRQQAFTEVLNKNATGLD
jgi:hypothetical protein